MLTFYDFEVFKFDWLVVFINPYRGEVTEIVDDPDKLAEYYDKHKDEIFVSYNGKYQNMEIIDILD